ncbi:hypothetical protein RJT34_04482 [Clitoria ternatea]|uniref:CRC domain-containing protein n=1 Tax=Clitoria ternatea TaxID=43366 RepID=A0AAN9Q2P5_CLITE
MDSQSYVVFSVNSTMDSSKKPISSSQPTSSSEPTSPSQSLPSSPPDSPILDVVDPQPPSEILSSSSATNVVRGYQHVGFFGSLVLNVWRIGGIFAGLGMFHLNKLCQEGKASKFKLHFGNVDGQSDGKKGKTERCTCESNACMKLACECFAAKEYCTEACTCQCRINRPNYRDDDAAVGDTVTKEKNRGKDLNVATPLALVLHTMI